MTMNAHESSCFAAGQDCGARTAACVARFTALELTAGARWWNRRRRRLIAGALIACAEELERTADMDRQGTAGALVQRSTLRLARAGDRAHGRRRSPRRPPVAAAARAPDPAAPGQVAVDIRPDRPDLQS